MQGSGFRVRGSGLRIQDQAPGYLADLIWTKVIPSLIKVSCFRFRVQGSGIKFECFWGLAQWESEALGQIGQDEPASGMALEPLVAFAPSWPRASEGVRVEGHRAGYGSEACQAHRLGVSLNSRIESTNEEEKELSTEGF